MRTFHLVVSGALTLAACVEVGPPCADEPSLQATLHIFGNALSGQNPEEMRVGMSGDVAYTDTCYSEPREATFELRRDGVVYALPLELDGWIGGGPLDVRITVPSEDIDTSFALRAPSHFDFAFSAAPQPNESATLTWSPNNEQGVWAAAFVRTPGETNNRTYTWLGNDDPGAVELPKESFPGPGVYEVHVSREYESKTKQGDLGLHARIGIRLMSEETL